MRNIETCPTCMGEGQVVEHACKTCNGQGINRTEQEVEVNIPKGIREEHSLTMSGMGNAVKGGTSGNLIISITESTHKDFIRNNNDLKYKVKLTYPSLVLGDKVEIPTIDGSNIRVTIPEYSNVGDNLRIPNKGLNIINNEGKRGDLIINLDIEIPKQIDDETRELLNKLKNIKESVA